MKLSDQQIQTFIEAWQKDFNETLSPEKARAEATRLLDFFASMHQMLRRPKSGETTSAPDRQSSDESDLKKAWRKTMNRGRL